MDKYTDLNDYELVSIAQEQNEDAINILHEKYKPLINKKSRKYIKYLHNKGIELADLIQECTIGFEEAIQNFNPHDDVSFYTFANICMDRQLMSELTKQNRAKYKILNEAVPLETLEVEKDNNNLIDIIKDNTNNPELDVLSSEEYKELCSYIMKHLTDFEECVFKLKIQGFNYKEIADILDKEEKSIDNAIQRMKIKIKNIIKDYKN